MSDTASISSADSQHLPTAPAGWKYVHLLDPDKLNFDTNSFLTLIYGDYTYTALSDVLNNVSMLIIGFDTNMRIVKSVKKTGARYLWQITFDDDRKGVNFIGQSRRSVHATLAELADLDEVQTTTENSSKLPPAPDGWKYFNLIYPDKTLSNTTKYPTLVRGSYTYTALSKTTDKHEMLVIGWDAAGKIVLQFSKYGGRWIWRISVDTNQTAATFWGENYDSIQLTLDELIPDPNISITTSNGGDFPPAPDGWVYCCISDPDQIQVRRNNIPIITFGTNTYTALSRLDGEAELLILGWNKNGRVFRSVLKPGARYLWQIRYDYGSNVVTFIGQNHLAVYATVAELQPRGNTPYVTTSDRDLFPSAPGKYTNLVDPDELGGDFKHYPILMYKSFTITALSKINNAESMVFVCWDAAGDIVKTTERNGARYIWQISNNGHLIYFTGQSRKSILVRLAELIPESED